MKTLIAVLGLSLGQFAFGQSDKIPFTIPTFSAQQKVILVMLENTSYKEAIAAPFLGKLATDGALFTNYHAIGHPSQPNYVALAGGDTLGVSGDGHYDLAQSNLADLLESKGLTWKVYAEDFPGKCFLGDSKGKYARKHVPFISFKDIQSNPARCANITDSTSFANDFKLGHLANYNMYIPNLNDDGHDTNVTFADNYMSQTFGPLIADPQLMKDVLLIVTFDEDDAFLGLGSNQVYTAIYGPLVKAGTKIATNYDHYSLLRTIEDGFQLGNLGRQDSKAVDLTDFWQ